MAIAVELQGNAGNKISPFSCNKFFLGHTLSAGTYLPSRPPLLAMGAFFMKNLPCKKDWLLSWE